MTRTVAEQPIGIFDSGVGGLTVFKEIRRQLPAENIIYLGDTARVPYGIRSPKTVVKYSMANTDFLRSQNVKLLVIACNTASAVATQALREICDIPVIDVVVPGARRAVAATGNKCVGIIGTEGTIRSGAYEKAIKRLDERISIYTQACPLFVPLAEEGWCASEDQVVLLTAQRYLAPLTSCGIDTLVLGCTHYPILKAAIQKTVGETITLIDSAEETAAEVAAVLQSRKIINSSVNSGLNKFYLTDIPHRFTETGRLFLGQELENVSVIDIL